MIIIVIIIIIIITTTTIIIIIVLFKAQGYLAEHKCSAVLLLCIFVKGAAKRERVTMLSSECKKLALKEHKR